MILSLILNIVFLFFIFYLIAKVCDQYFIKSLDIISEKLKLSQDIAGATLLAIGSSAPELFVALIALTKVGSESIGVGAIVGSAIFNILVIIGGSAIVATAFLKWLPTVRDIGVYIIALVILMITFQDGIITLQESIIYIIIYILYLFLLSKWNKFVPNHYNYDPLEEVPETLEDIEDIKKEKKNVFSKILKFFDYILDKLFPDLEKRPNLYLLSFIISIILIAGFSYFLVEIAIDVSHILNIPSIIIALTVLAIGTSIPDLISSIIVAKQGRGAMAISNGIGSNTFDILIGLGFPWLLYILITGNNIVVSGENLISSILLLFFTVIVVLFLLLFQRFEFGKKAGWFLIIIYILYLLFAISQGMGWFGL